MAERLRISLLGQFRVEIGGLAVPATAWRRRKAAAIVKVLALAPQHRRHREEILGLLWPDLDPESAVNNLHQNVHVARRLFSVHWNHVSSSQTALRNQEPPRLLTHDGAWLTLADAADVETDVERFLAARQDAQSSRSREAYERAIACYHGNLLPDDRNEDWTIAPRESLRADYLSLLLDLAAACEAQGDGAAAVAALERAVEADPLFEEAHRALMRVQAATGQRAKAILHFGRLREVLRRELDCDPDDASQALFQDLLRTQHDAPAPASFFAADGWETRSGGSPLPNPRTSFVGRSREIAQVRTLLSERRLVTLTGAGGSGKTRLAIEVAKACDDVAFVDLITATEPSLVPEVVAAALAVAAGTPAEIASALNQRLIGRDAVVVLDNCEHVIEQCAGLVASLLDSVPSLRILATSREPLAIDGETLYRVPSLSTPPVAHGAADSVRPDPKKFEAVQLFLERVRAHVPDYEPSPDRLDAVSRICARLDGIPLAIELAAGRIDVLTEEQIAARLDDALGLLASTNRSAPPRHRTLRSAADWGYALLTGAEQRLFRRLGVLRGDWTLDAAVAVGVDRGELPVHSANVSEPGILDLMASLFAKSVLVAIDTGGEMRYRILEPLRQFAVEKLGVTGELDEVGKRHFDWVAAWIETCCQGLTGGDEAVWLDRLDRGLLNIRVALQWACDHREVEPILRLSGRFWRFWQSRGHLLEGIQWLERLLAVPADLPNHVRASAENALGSLYRDVDQLESALPRFRHARDLWLADDNLAGVMTVAINLGNALRDLGRYEESRPLLLEGEQLAQQLQAGRETALASLNLGRLDRLTGDIDAARDRFHYSLDRFRASGDAQGEATALNRLGDLARLTGDYAEAQAYHQTALSLQQRRADPWGCAISLVFLAQTDHLRGEPARAAASVRDALALLRDLGVRREVPPALEVVAMLCADAGGRERAVRFFAAAEATRRIVRNGVPPPDDAVGRTRDALRAAVPPEQFSLWWQRGMALTTTAAIDEALAALTEKMTIAARQRV